MFHRHVWRDLGRGFFNTAAHGHGVIGKRFIPSTLTIEDPFPSDEMDLLRFQRGSKNKEGRETSVSSNSPNGLRPTSPWASDGNIYLSSRVKPTRAGHRAPPIRSFPLSIPFFETLNTKVYSAWG